MKFSTLVFMAVAVLAASSSFAEDKAKPAPVRCPGVVSEGERGNIECDKLAPEKQATCRAEQAAASASVPH